MSTAPASRNLWPYGIATCLVAFVAGLGVLITLALRQKDHLVAQDYYEQELRFQEQIDRRNRAEALPAPVRFEVDKGAGELRIRLPVEHARAGVAGRVGLFRPSDARLDRTLPLAVDAEGVQRVGLAGLAPGLWRVRVEWSCGGISYAVSERLEWEQPAETPPRP
jgi:hypothetical protein